MEIVKYFSIIIALSFVISSTASAVEEISRANGDKVDTNLLKPTEHKKITLEDSTGPTVSRVKRHFGYGYGYDPYYYGYYPRPLPVPVPVLVGGGLLVGGYRGFGFRGIGGPGFGLRGFGGRGFGARGFGGRGFGGGFGRGRG